MSTLWGRAPPATRCMHSTVQAPARLCLSTSSFLSVRPVPCQLQTAARPHLRPTGCRQPLVVAKAAKAKALPEGTKEAVSHLRFSRGSTDKYRRVLDQIRGRSYPEALALLERMPFRACEPLKDLLIGVAADAKHNFQMTKTRLFVSECYANQAPTIKRFRPRARGRGYRIKKGVSHITIKVREGIALDESTSTPAQA